MLLGASSRPREQRGGRGQGEVTHEWPSRGFPQGLSRKGQWGRGGKETNKTKDQTMTKSKLQVDFTMTIYVNRRQCCTSVRELLKAFPMLKQIYCSAEARPISMSPINACFCLQIHSLLNVVQTFCVQP